MKSQARSTTKLNTTLEAAGAEHLVIGQLLIRGRQAFRAQANQLGYDIVVVDPDRARSIKVQVKSRAASDAGGFTVSHWDFDLLVMVRLNLGDKAALKSGEGSTPQPEFHAIVREKLATFEARGSVKFRLNAIPPCLDDWSAVDEAFDRAASRSYEGFYLDEFGRRRDHGLLDIDD